MASCEREAWPLVDISSVVLHRWRLGFSSQRASLCVAGHMESERELNGPLGRIPSVSYRPLEGDVARFFIIIFPPAHPTGRLVCCDRI